MGQKKITVYTPASAEPHIFAEDDAQMHRGVFPASGILESDERLACTIVDNNTVRLASGMYSNQGHLICVPGGETEDLTIISGTGGAYRKDLIVADFTRGGGDTADDHVFRVLTGTEAASLEGAQDPALEQDNLAVGGAHRQEALYRVTLFGVQIITIERLTDIIAAHAQMPYVNLTSSSGTIALETNMIYRVQLVGETHFTLPSPTPGLQDQIMLYATVGEAADVHWPAGCIYVLGMKPLLRAGKYYRIVIEYDPNAAAWCVGAIESEAASA